MSVADPTTGVADPMTEDAPDPSVPPVPRSVLELGGRLPETGAERSLQDMVDTAQTADAYGYARFWVAEHHSSHRTASGVPSVLIAHLAARTERIRVGSGGVMLPNHPPLTVAEQFATLQALYPGRIDLGLGRSLAGPVTPDGLMEAALRRDPLGAAEFPERIDELLGFLLGRGPEQHRFHALPLTPRPSSPPEVHVLGAGEGSARTAAERGLPFAYGHHLGRSKCRPAATARYRSAFRAARAGGRPYLVVAVNVVCAETDEEAEALALDASARLGGPHREAAADTTLSPDRALYVARRTLDENQVVHGAPAKVNAELDALAGRLGADELMLVPYELTGAARCRTLRLAATARQTPPREPLRRPTTAPPRRLTH
ncbi:MsnO8 family LLM class oxidoreductase [Streptomyces sp. NPDC002701]|uniref:MsnO8 family LLM class oxidoreductase n=1 Tax=Streptomyces sp. NPDC002701 TaxID=3364661 RepID=UPI0036AECB5B